MRIKSLLIQSLLTAWLGICAGLFVSVNASDFLHITLFPDWAIFSASLTRIHFVSTAHHLLSAFMGATLFSLACLSLGLWFLRDHPKNQAPKLGLVATAFVLGEIVVSIIFLLLLHIGFLLPTTSAVSLLLAFLAGLPTLRAWTSSSPCIPTQTNLHQSERLFLALIGIIVFFGLFYSLARLSYDAVAEYFSNAKIMAITGRPIIFYPSDLFVVSSFHPGILFTAIIQLFGDQAARMLSWVNGLLILAGGWALGKKAGLSEQVRLYFLILMLTSTAFVDLLGDGKVELISTAPIVVTLWWMLDSLQNPSRGRFLLIGTLLGFAIIARPYNIFLVPVFTVLFYLWQVLPVWRRDGFAAALRFARPVLWTFPTLVAMSAFHLWQNDLWLGSPLAPLTYARELESADWQWQFDPALLNTLRLLYPLTVTFMNSPQSLGTISPLFIGTLTFLLLPNVRARLYLADDLKSLLLPALVTLVLWIALFFTVVEIRYVFFLWVVLFLFSAQVIEAAMADLQKGYQTMLHTVFAFLLVFIAIRTLVISLTTYSPIDANGQAHCADISLCTFLDPLNQKAAEGERIFVLHAYRYYLRPDLFACSSQAQEYAALQALARENSGEFWAELYRKGFRYVTYEQNFAEFHTRFGTIPPYENAPKWLKITLISSTGSEMIYQLQSINSPSLPFKTCVKTDNHAWQVIAK